MRKKLQKKKRAFARPKGYKYPYRKRALIGSYIYTKFLLSSNETFSFFYFNDK